MIRLDFLIPCDMTHFDRSSAELAYALTNRESYFQPALECLVILRGFRTHCATFRAAMHTRPSVESVHAAVALARTGLHIPIYGDGTLAMFAEPILYGRRGRP